MNIFNRTIQKRTLKFALVTLLLIACDINQSNELNIQDMSKAVGMAETSQLKQAEKLLAPILKNNPGWGEGWIYLGRSLAAQGRFAEGAVAVEKGGILGERRTSVWLEACSMALKSGNEQLAISFLERGLQNNIHRPWLIETFSFDGFLDLGDFLDTDVARKLLLEASKKRPSLHPDLIAMDRKFLTQRKKLEPQQIQLMVEKYAQITASFPENGELYYRLGKVQVRFGDYNDALISFQRSKDLNYLSVYNDGWLAHVNARLGNKNEAFIQLERNLAVMDTPDWIFHPGEFDSLQNDPRWKEVVDAYRPNNTPSFQIPAREQGSVPYPTTKWSRTDPTQVGIKEKSLLEAASTIESSFPNVASLLVVKNGYLVFERYFNGYTDQDAFNMKSATKSFTSTIAGIMDDQDILPDLNTPIVEILPEYFNDIDDPLKHQITLKHLLTMTVGLDWHEGEEKALDLFLTGNYAELILKEPQVHQPGEAYEYSSAVSHLLAVCLAKLSGQNLLSYTQKNLFDPLGITPEVWAQDLNGNYLGDGELRLRPQDLAKFGLLILRGGIWDRKSVVSAEWVQNATTIQVSEARGPHTSYGFQFWVINVGGHRVIKAAGYGGQRCWIIPSLDLVVVITSEPLTPDNDPDAILGQFIIPSVQSGDNE